MSRKRTDTPPSQERIGKEMQVCLIQVPYMIGDGHQGGSKGPGRFVQAGAKTLLETLGVDVTVELIERGEPFRDSVSASAVVNRRLASAVRRAVGEKQFPLVLAGSCDACIGVVAGIEHQGCGVVWFDAHGDFNTPETTISGFFGGMSLAVITGHCYRNLWAQIGDNAPVAEAATLMLGVRDLDPAERERFEQSEIQVVNWHEGEPLGDVNAALDQLGRRAEEVCVHIDLDALDPAVAPGIVDSPVPGGLTLEQLHQVILGVAARFRIRAAVVATYNPDLDQDDKTLRVGLHFMELLAECVSAQ